MNSEEYSFFHCDLSHGRIKFKTSNNVSFVIALQLVFVLFERFFIQLGAPSAIIYIIDILNVYLVIKIISYKNCKQFWLLLIGYITIVLTSTIIAFPNYLIWGGNLVFTIIEIRNIIRFLIFFLACVTFLKEKEIESIFKFLIVFFYVNSIYIIYQYFTFWPENTWTRGDLLNGFFGTTTGGNTFVNVLMLTVVAYLLSMWVNGYTKFVTLLIPLILSISVAGLIELKAYFVEVVILYVWYLISKRKSRKELKWNMLLIIAFFSIAYIALQYMYKEYPWFRDSMSLNGMFALLSDSKGYTGNQDLNRFTGIFTISENIFKGNIGDILFGIGLGNASIYTLDGTSTLFSQLYAQNHYSWFSSTYVFIQCGLLGIIIYVFMFIYLLVKKKSSHKFRLVSEIMALLAIVLIFYGEALKTDAGYFVYFVLACGFIITNKNISQEM